MANTTTKREDMGTTGTPHGAGQQMKHRLDEGVEKAKGTVAGIAEKAKDMAGSAMETAGNIAQGAGKTAANVASYVGQKAEDATEAVGHGMRSLGGTIREKGPESGFLGAATSSVASGLENAGGYLEEEGLSGIGRDITGLIRRYPVAAICAGLFVGFMLARATRA